MLASTKLDVSFWSEESALPSPVDVSVYSPDFPDSSLVHVYLHHVIITELRLRTFPLQPAWLSSSKPCLRSLRDMSHSSSERYLPSFLYSCRSECLMPKWGGICLHPVTWLTFFLALPIPLEMLLAFHTLWSIADLIKNTPGNQATCKARLLTSEY